MIETLAKGGGINLQTRREQRGNNIKKKIIGSWEAESWTITDISELRQKTKGLVSSEGNQKVGGLGDNTELRAGISHYLTHVHSLPIVTCGGTLSHLFTARPQGLDQCLACSRSVLFLLIPNLLSSCTRSLFTYWSVWTHA